MVTMNLLKALVFLLVVFFLWLPACEDHMRIFTEEPHTYVRNQHISIGFSL